MPRSDDVRRLWRKVILGSGKAWRCLRTVNISRTLCVFMFYGTRRRGTNTCLQYGNDGSYALMFDLYADKLLKVNIVQPDVFDTRAFPSRPLQLHSRSHPVCR